VPTGTQELVINLETNAFDIRRANEQACPQRFSGAMVSGCYSQYFVIDTRAHANLLGVHFKPGGARPILGLPVGALADAHVDLDRLWGPIAQELRERLAHASGTPEQFRILELEMLKRLARDSRPDTDPAMAHALDLLTRQRRTVGAVAQELGLTGRRFIERFSAEVGMTPKLYARVWRFQRAIMQARTKRTNWVELALHAGYCDQSHLIRDFVSFSGASPSALLCQSDRVPKEHHLVHSGKIHPRRP